MAESFTKEIVLSDGRIAKMRRPTAADLIKAQDGVGPSENKFKYICCLLAEIVTIDGKQQVFEDIKALWATDVDRLSKEANGLDFLSSSARTSPA